MSERYFIVNKVTKTAQGANTQFDKSRKYTGTPSAAARKAMTYTCGRIGKRVKGRCTLTITVQEVKSTGKPILDKQGIFVMYKYKLKRFLITGENDSKGVVVNFGEGKEIKFKYQTQILESYGRVLS